MVLRGCLVDLSVFVEPFVLISDLKWKKDPVCSASEYCKTTYDSEEGGVAPCEKHSDCDKIWECDNLCSVFGRL